MAAGLKTRRRTNGPGRRGLNGQVVAFIAETEPDAGLLISGPCNHAIEHHFLRGDSNDNRIPGSKQHADGTNATATVADILDNTGDIAWFRMHHGGPMAVQAFSPSLLPHPYVGIPEPGDQLGHFAL